MEGEPSVIALFKDNPFQGQPPDRIRFPLYQYHFTDFETLKKTGNYWQRKRIGYYAPTIMKDPESKRFRFEAPSA